MSARRVPASVGQRLLWFLDRYTGSGGALNCPMVCRIRGQLDDGALLAAIGHLSARHDALRTTFAGAGRQLTQVIHKSRPLEVTSLDLSGAADPEAAVGEALATELRTRVDPLTPPVRVTVWRVGDREHVLCMNMHHLVTDTWSCAVLFRELAAAYGGAELPPVGWQYPQFTAWQDWRLRSEASRRHQEYWRRQLIGVELPRLPFKGNRISAAGVRASLHAAIDPAVGATLRQLALANRTTLFTVMLSVYYGLLHRVTGQDDLAVSTLFANRSRPELERTVGFLANLVVLRAELPVQATFTDVVRHARTTVVDAFAHQELPYHVLSQDTGRTVTLRADDIVFQMLAEEIDLTVSAGGVEFQGVVPDVVGRFDFEFALMPRGGGFAVKLFYTEDRLDGPWAHDFIAGYAELAAAVASAPDVPLTDLPLSPR